MAINLWCPFDEEWSAFYQYFKENDYKVIRSSLSDRQNFFHLQPENRWTVCANGKNDNPTYALIDLQGVKTVYNSERKKRHIVTDIMGNFLAVHVHVANVHDTKGGVFIFEKAF